MTREKAIETIKSMPRDFNIDQLVERLIIIEKVEEAETDVRDGRIYTHTEVKNLFEGWKK